MPSSAERILVLIVGDNAGIRDGVRAIINTQLHMIVVGEAINREEAVQHFKTLMPDITIIDVNRPVVRGNETSVGILAEFPKARIIVITALDGDDYIRQAFDIGVRAVLFNDMLRRELLPAIRAVHVGQQYIPKAIAERLKRK